MHVIDNEAVPALGEVQVVQVRAALHAQRFKVGPQHGGTHRARNQRTARGADLGRFQCTAALMSQEDVTQGVAGGCAERREKARRRMRLAAETIVARAVEMNHAKVLLDLLDGGHETLMKLGVGKQAVRRIVRCQHDARAELDSRVEKTAHQKSIGNIVHVEFVEAQQLDTVEPLFGHRAEPVVAARLVHEALVHLAQKLVKVQPPLAAFHEVEHRVDHEALAAPRQPVAINSLIARVSAAARRNEQCDERRDCSALPGIGNETALGEFACDQRFVKHTLRPSGNSK